MSRAPWRPSEILAAPKGSLPGDHMPGGFTDADDARMSWGFDQVTESDMILALAEQSGLSEDAMVLAAASTARSTGRRISDVIADAYREHCTD
jgi:hypothetical protein